MFKAKEGFQARLSGSEGVNHLQAISLCFISDVQGPVNSCPDKPLSALPSLQAVCSPRGAVGWREFQGFKVKAFQQKTTDKCYKKGEQEGTSRLYDTFVNMSSCAGGVRFVHLRMRV